MHMKKAIASLMALMVSLTITLADTHGFGNLPPNSYWSNGQVKGLGTNIVHYTATYPDYYFGQVTCTGVHQTGKNFGQGGQDSFTCTAQPAGAVLQNVTPNEMLTLSMFGGWVSDYNAAFALAFTGVVSSDGTSYTAVANY